MKNVINLKKIGEGLLKMEKENQSKIYVANDKQMGKYNYAKGFFIKYLREEGGNLQTTDNEKGEHGGLTFTKDIICLTGMELWRFVNTLKFASVVSIDTTIDGKVCVSLTIPKTKREMKGEK